MMIVIVMMMTTVMRITMKMISAHSVWRRPVCGNFETNVGLK